MRLDHLDFLDICRDERCETTGLHRPHPVRGTCKRSVVRVEVRRLLVDLTFAAVSPRLPKTFKDIYGEVLYEYGSITERNVYAAISELRAERQIALIVPAGSQDVVHREGIRGAYIRYDSPLLWQPDGLRGLMEQVHDLVGDQGRRPARTTTNLRPRPLLDIEDAMLCGA